MITQSMAHVSAEIRPAVQRKERDVMDATGAMSVALSVKDFTKRQKEDPKQMFASHL